MQARHIEPVLQHHRQPIALRQPERRKAGGDVADLGDTIGRK